MIPLFDCLDNCYGHKCYNEINSYGYPTTWDLHPLMSTQVSVFNPPIWNINRFKNLNLLMVYRLITTSTVFKNHTEKLRSLPEKEVKKYKSTNFYFACFSGTFYNRSKQGLRLPSGLICLDIDHVKENLTAIKEAVNLLPQTVMSFISPSGNGLKVLFRVNETDLTHEQYYKQCSQFLINSCNLTFETVDPHCQDVSRACFLPYDPTCYLNPKLGLL